MKTLPRFLLTLILVLTLAGCTLPAPVAQTQPVDAPAADVVRTVHTPDGEVTLAGRWDGAISIMGSQLRIIVNFSEEAGAVIGVMDIPQQGATGIPLHNLRFDAPVIYFEILPGPRLAVFDGTVEPDGSITGSFSQSGITGTFQLLPVAEVEPVAAEDLPYIAEEVTFGHGEVTLAGTLTLPEGAGPHPAVILVSGSGQQNRDSEIPMIPGYRPFAVLADTLTRQGIAVLRYDDRGVGGSTGEVMLATSADFSEDTEAALNYLREHAATDPQQIGILGHSEGGLIAVMLASRNPHVAFVILMAGQTASGEVSHLAQIRMLNEAQGVAGADLERILALQQHAYETVKTGEGWDEFESALRQETSEQLEALPEAARAQLGNLETFVEQSVAQQMAVMRLPWFHFYITYDPALDLVNIDVPILALFGALDLQVEAELNQAALLAAVEQSDNEDVTIVIFPEANHLFQLAESGHPEEYALLAPDFLPGFLETISEWLLERVEIAAH
jgi:uncharacterized protein